MNSGSLLALTSVRGAGAPSREENIPYWASWDFPWSLSCSCTSFPPRFMSLWCLLLCRSQANCCQKPPAKCSGSWCHPKSSQENPHGVNDPRAVGSALHIHLIPIKASLLGREQLRAGSPWMSGLGGRLSSAKGRNASVLLNSMCQSSRCLSRLGSGCWGG